MVLLRGVYSKSLFRVTCVYVMNMGEKGVKNSSKLILFKLKDKYTD